MLGHFDIRTTERYVHVRKDQLINIVSPLDDLWLKGDIRQIQKGDITIQKGDMIGIENQRVNFLNF